MELIVSAQCILLEVAFQKLFETLTFRLHISLTKLMMISPKCAKGTEQQQGRMLIVLKYMHLLKIGK